MTPRRAAILASGLFVLTGLLWYATTLVRLPTGFSARYFAGSDLSNRPAVATIDPSVTADVVRRAWPLPDQALTAIWDGYLTLGRGGARRVSLVSDGSSYLYVDDRLLNETALADTVSPAGRKRRVLAPRNVVPWRKPKRRSNPELCAHRQGRLKRSGPSR